MNSPKPPRTRPPKKTETRERRARCAPCATVFHWCSSLAVADAFCPECREKLGKAGQATKTNARDKQVNASPLSRAQLFPLVVQEKAS